MKGKRAFPACTTLKNEEYVIVTTGYDDGYNNLKTTEILQIQEGSTFQPGPPMVTGVWDAELVPAHPKQESSSCYLIGGENDSGYSEKIYFIGE